MAKYKNVEEWTNPQTGEVVTYKKSWNVPVANSDEFYMAFVSVVVPTTKLKSGVDRDILAHLCGLMKYNENVVDLSPATRADICEKYGLTNTNLSRALRHLVDAELISPGSGKGRYVINELFFWKGTTDSRDKVLKEKGLSFSFKFGGNNE